MITDPKFGTSDNLSIKRILPYLVYLCGEKSFNLRVFVSW